jgi:hypothetical protein
MEDLDGDEPLVPAPAAGSDQKNSLADFFARADGGPIALTVTTTTFVTSLQKTV